MIAWLAPGAFVAFVLLAGPIVVHLLARRTARRLVFPATHFVRATQAAAVRLRRPSDVGLLLLRLAIVAAAVIAVAQPVVLTRWRTARWNARVTRAIVVDASRSMRSDSASDAASRMASQQSADAFMSRRIDTEDLADGVDRAIAWTATTPPSRREIVIVSDFQRGSIARDVIDAIPADVGVRLIRAGTPPATRTETLGRIDGWRGGAWVASQTVDAAGTHATWERKGSSPVPTWITVDSSDPVSAGRALHAALSPGVPAGDEAQRVRVVFAGAPAPAPARAIESWWIVQAAQAFRDSPLLREAAVETGPDRLRLGEYDGAMVVDAPIASSSLAAAAVIRAAILAVRPAAMADAESEVATIADEDLARWRRDAAPVGAQVKPGPDASDARWFWALALALLGAESIVRRRRDRTVVQGAHVDAAA